MKSITLGAALILATVAHVLPQKGLGRISSKTGI